MSTATAFETLMFDLGVLIAAGVAFASVFVAIDVALWLKRRRAARRAAR